jgi:type VI secretion system protein ImpB
MAKKNTGSVAPKERINISYKPATGNARETVELPFKMVVLGDFHCRQDERTVEEREPINVNKNNFDDIMEDAKLHLNMTVKNHLDQKDDSEINIDIDVKSLKDLEPDSLMKSIPELRRVYELRESLLALKGPLGNNPQMRRAIMAMVKDKDQRGRLLQEIGLK